MPSELQISYSKLLGSNTILYIILFSRPKLADIVRMLLTHSLLCRRDLFY